MKGLALAVLAIFTSAVIGIDVIGPSGNLTLVNKDIAPDGYPRA
jgi:hypothetical protein